MVWEGSERKLTPYPISTPLQRRFAARRHEVPVGRASVRRRSRPASLGQDSRFAATKSQLTSGQKLFM